MQRFLRRLQRQLRPTPVVAGSDAASGSGKQFAAELTDFTQRIRDAVNFSLVRFGDGEMMIIDGLGIDLSEKYNGEHKYSPGDPQHEQQRERLRQSLTYQSAAYHVGIACPCCVGEENFFKLKQRSAQAESQLTWANLFVNSNFAAFRAQTIPALAQRQVSVVCHRNAQPEQLPFNIDAVFTVGANAWVDDYQRVLTEIETYIEQGSISNQVFIFCAGVLSNVLIHTLAQRFPDNCYLDMGSVFDVDMGLGKTRKYLKKGRTLKKTCIWL